MRGTGERYQDSSGGTFSCEAIGKTLSKPLHRQTILEITRYGFPGISQLHCLLQRLPPGNSSRAFSRSETLKMNSATSLSEKPDP